MRVRQNGFLQGKFVFRLVPQITWVRCQAMEEYATYVASFLLTQALLKDNTEKGTHSWSWYTKLSHTPLQEALK